MLEKIDPGVTSARRVLSPILKVLPFYINILICAGCWKPVVEDTDDDLKEILLADSDLCRCHEEAMG